MDSKVKTVIRIVVGLLVVVGVVLGLRAWTARSAKAKADAAKGAAAAADRPVSVLAVPVVQKDMPIYLEGIGNVIAFATVTVRTQVDGRIDKIGFVEGQDVKKGDLIAQIDPRPYQATLNSAQAALARDSAQLAGAQKDYERYTELSKNGLSSQQQVDDQKALVAQLRGSAAADAAAIESARLNVEYAHIVSPIDGVAGIRQVDQGNLIHASDPGGIVVLTTLDPIAVVFTLPQDNLPEIAKEMAAGGVKLLAMSRDGATKLAEGTLGVIDNQILTATATIKLKGIFPNAARTLWPQQFVKVRLLIATRKNALVVPAAVIQHGPNGDFVYAIAADQTAVVKPIKLDILQGESAILASGVAVGDQIVIDGQQNLRPGSKVVTRAPDGTKVKPDASAAPAPNDPKAPKEGKKEKASGSGAGQ